MAELYFRQLLVGGMQNFVYLIGDKDAGECLIVDPAWAIEDIIAVAGEDGMKITGALATHYHPDHVGGEIFGLSIEGLPKLLEVAPCKIHCHREEAEGIRVMTSVSESDLVKHDANDKVKVGEVEIELLHTPGHTPGSQCFRVGQALVAGDTLFLEGCGRTDLPGGDSEELYRTISERFSKLPDDLILYPGHAYSGESAPLGEVRKTNFAMKVSSLDEWKQMMG